MAKRQAGKGGGSNARTRDIPRTRQKEVEEGHTIDPPQDSFGISDRKHQIQIGNRILPSGPTKLGSKKLDILPDMPDVRDRIYAPHLRALHPAIYPRVAFSVRDQGEDSSCTGFSLAHVIDALLFREVGPSNPVRVSARMLYEMAKRNDEWEGSAYEGSSVRGAIKGFFRNGVCSDATAPDAPGVKDWALTYKMGKEARETRLGAYFRLQPDLSDYHAALNEVGAIYVSAQIHSNWDKPENGRIKPGGKSAGGHAFCILGYDDEGFWVLNSWGPSWGSGGVAHWSYVDWASTVMDAWVLQLGVRAPNAFGAIPRAAPSSASGLFGFGEPNRSEILGHFINIDDGRLITDGKYGSPRPKEMAETVERVTNPQSNNKLSYDHFIIYAHGGLNSLADEARRIDTWKRNDIFGRNKIYHFHLMWGSGFLDEIFGEMSKSPIAGRAGGRIADWLFEAGVGKEIGAYAWRNMKQDAFAAFDGSDDYNGGSKGLAPLLTGFDKSARRPKLHLVGHSAGSIVLGYLLSNLWRFGLKNIDIESIHLMAPACTVDFFKTHYSPYLDATSKVALKDKIYLYNLSDVREEDDSVSTNIPLVPSYSRSLLHLVSRAYEDKPKTPIAGMQAYSSLMPKSRKLSVSVAGVDSGTESASHGGFDNDARTLTTIMARILGEAPKHPPMRDELTGY